MNADTRAMPLPDVYRAIGAALDRGGLDRASAETFTVRIQEIQALTTWAPGMIDPEGRGAAISLGLEAQLKVVFEHGRERAIAQLHDALAELRSVIRSHDTDLDADAEDDSWDD